MRRLDPWAVLLLGVLVTLGVIILLATPGPWHHVAPGATPHPPLAPPAPPNDLLVFVTDATGHRCGGAVWLHIDYALPRFIAAVVPVRLTCLLPRAGLQPLSQVVDEAGAATAAKGLGQALGVAFDAWITVDPQAVRDAAPGFIRAPTQAVHPRPILLAGVWDARLQPIRALKRQVRFLRGVLARWSADELNLVGFVNYVLGSTDVSTSMKLQAASAIGGALDAADQGDFVTSSLPVTVFKRSRYERWLPARLPLTALRQSSAFDALPPIFAPSVTTRAAGRSVVVLTSPLGRLAGAYRVALRRALASYGTTGVQIDMRVCRTPADVTDALERRGRHAPLGAIVALGRTRVGVAAATPTRVLIQTAVAALRASTVPAIVSEVPPESTAAGAAGASLNDMIDSLAADAGLPLSPVGAVVTASSGAPAPTVPSPSSGATRPAAGAATPTAGASQSPSPGAAGSSSGMGTLTLPAATAWAQLDAATFARAVQPAFFAPLLPATRLGVTYYQRLSTRVTVVDDDAAAAARLVAHLGAFGYTALAGNAPGLASQALPVVYYGPGQRRAALALAGDLGLRPGQALAAPGGRPALTLVVSATYLVTP
jgi:hypothetical protein